MTTAISNNKLTQIATSFDGMPALPSSENGNHAGELVPMNGGQTSLANRRFVLLNPDAPSPTFLTIGQCLMQSEKFPSPASAAVTKTVLYGQHDTFMKAIQAAVDQTNYWLFHARKAADINSGAPHLQLIPDTTDIGFPLAQKPIGEVHAGLVSSLNRTSSAYVRGLIKVLNKSVMTLSGIGLIAFSEQDPRVCQFYHPQRTVQESARDAGTFREHTRTETYAATIRDLVDAEPVAVPPSEQWPKLKIPTRVWPVLEKIPGVLRPHCRIVSGSLIHRLVISRTQTESWTTPIPAPVYKPDPALVLGPYVIAAWES